MTHEPHDPTRGELDLLAQAYVLGELTESESTEFELRLAEDQDARDAVALAVRMIEAVASAEPAPIRQLPRRSSTRWIAAAAVIAIGIGLTFALSTSRGSEDSENLIASWIDLGDANGAEQDVDPDVDDEASAEEAYDWLFSALEEKDR